MAQTNRFCRGSLNRTRIILPGQRGSSVVSSMPRAVIESGAAEQELPPEELAALLTELAEAAGSRDR